MRGAQRSTEWFRIAVCILRWQLLWMVIVIPAVAQKAAFLEKAREAMQLSHYGDAEQSYRKALAVAPTSLEALTGLGLSLQMQGRNQEAIHEYTLALQQRYVPETYALLAAERCKVGELSAAKPMLDKLYREQRENLHVAAIVAPCYLEVDEPIESAVFYRLLVGSKEYPEDLAGVQLAKSLIRSGQIFAEKLSKMPDSEPYMDALRKGSAEGSQAAHEAYAFAAKHSPYFRADLDWTGALELWRQHPNDRALLYLLAVLSTEDAIKEIDEMAQRYPESPYVMEFYADALADQGHGKAAIAIYDQLAHDHPELSDVHYRLGLLYEKREEWEKAEAAYREQLKLYPDDQRAVAHLSRCLLQLEDYEAVRKLLAPVVHGQDVPYWARLNLATADERLGDTQAAIQQLVAAERNPHAGKQVHYQLMHLYMLAGRVNDAKREYMLFQQAAKH